ncbi:PWWP domain-containing protein 2A-like [Mercenaria mercenaria]|uniref:PWWP domain-containing protein 2A-like n=1 Tax=Mercenaria mercenaria TaxID=6596 RepID=UPI00234EB3C6|nr:PWWP domain-containing protein 2A-like [Mercenaria mercenaria]
MATEKRKSGSIFKGMKLTVLVEEMVNDVLVVVLEHGSKVYRGVLLDSNKRGLPSGICSAFGGSKNDNFEGGGDNGLDGSSVDKPVDMPASIFRHTYFPSMPNLATGMQAVPDRAFPKLGNNRTTRNIRLRPRQTLCSKCKSTCLDSQNGPVPVTSALASAASKQQLSSPSKQGAVKNDTKSIRKRASTIDLEPKPTKLIKVHSESCLSTKLTRSSPFIKISIGETNVMNIPPRIHELDRQISSDTEKSADEDPGEFVDSNDIDSKEKVHTNIYKKMLRHSQEERTSSDENKKSRSSAAQRKNKKSKHKPKDYDESDGDMPPNIIITENIDTSEDSEDLSENEPRKLDRVRPRLIYTWRQNKGLSPMHRSNSNESLNNRRSDSPNELIPSPLENLDGTPINEPEVKTNKRKKSALKEYKLRSRSRSLDSNPEYEITEDSAYISYEDPKSVSDRSEGCSTDADTTSDSDNSEYGDGPPGDDHVDAFKPLMMKIHTSSVSKCSIPDGRKLQTGDIVWGKVKGFPWWPGRIMTINVSQKDNAVVIRQIAQVAWFGSSTMSHISCSDLYPFLEDFKVRFNRKKRSTPYRRAIKQATIAAQSCHPHSDIDLEEFDVS